MKLLTRFAMMKKNVYVTDIPNNILEYKSDARIFDNTLYYLDKGEKMLSILGDTSKKMLVLNRLNNLDSYFRLNYTNLFIQKGSENLLGVVYPFNSKENFKDDCSFSNINNITDNEKVIEIFEKNKSVSLYTSKGVLLHILYLFEVLIYLNNNGISVKKLEINEIKEYSESYLERYVDIMNSIVLLDILENGESEFERIIEICFNYLNSIDLSFVNSLSAKLETEVKEASSLQICDFENILVENIESLITCNICGNDYNKAYKRCPICNEKDRFISNEELLKLPQLEYVKKLDVLDEYFDFYVSYLGIKFVLKDGVKLSYESKKLDIIIAYMEFLENSDIKYGYLYDSKFDVIGFDIDLENQYIYTLKEFFDKIIENMEYVGNLSIFKKTLNSIKDELEDLNSNNFGIKKDMIENFLVLEQPFKKVSIFTVPTCVSENYEKNINSYESICKMFFEYCQNKFNSKLVNGKIVSNRFDIIRLFNYSLVLEYQKFLDGNNYINSNPFINTLQNDDFLRESYDASYAVSPELCDIILEDEVRDYGDDYVLVKEELDKRAFCDFMTCYKELDLNSINFEIIAPECVVYEKIGNSIKYVGYLIKKKTDISFEQVFNNEGFKKYSNKELLKFIITFVQSMDSNEELYSNCFTLSSYFYYEEDFSDIFIKFSNEFLSNEKIGYFASRIVDRINANYSAVFKLEYKDVIPGNLKKLNKIYSSLKKYCKVHNVWYDNSLKKCPICEKYNEYIDIKKLKNKKMIFSCDFYDLVLYNKDYNVKLFKNIKNGTFCNGLSLKELEKNVISIIKNDNKFYKKVVKDFETEETIGILVSKSSYKSSSLYNLLCTKENTNLQSLGFVIGLLKSYTENFGSFKEKIKVFAQNNCKVESFVKNNIFALRNKFILLDYEFFKYNTTIDDEEVFEYLEQVIKYILLFDKKCIEYESIVYPPKDENYVENMKDTILNLERYVNKKLCCKHNVYYDPEDGGCPLCIEEMDDIVLTQDNIEDIKPKGAPFSQGAEAKVYKLGLRYLFKMYVMRKPNNDCDKKEELQKVLLDDFLSAMKRREEIFKILLEIGKKTRNDLKNKNFMIIFPKKGVYATEKKVFKGFIQEKVKDPVSLFLLLNSEKCKELGFTTKESLLKILVYYGEAIEYMHNSPIIRKIVSEGLIIGDVSGRNALYSKADKKIAIIDTDSVGTKKYPCCMYTTQFADPINVLKNKNASFQSDWYSYAVLCFFVLTKVHPFSGIYSEDISMDIQERMEKKISVIGSESQKIKIADDVAVKWDWMPEKLLKAFLDIFEKEKRYSILNILKETYNIITNTEEFIVENETSTSNDVESSDYVCEDVEEKNAEDEVKEDEVDNSKKSKLNIKQLFSNNDKIINNDEVFVEKSMLYFKDENQNISLHDYKKSTEKMYNKIFNSHGVKMENIHVEDGKGIAIIIYENRKYITSIKDKDFKLIYKMSDVNRHFIIRFDAQNQMYLLLSCDNVKSYVVKNDKVVKFDNLYKKMSDYQNEKIINFDNQTAFSFNSLYYPEDGYIVKYDLKTGKEQKVYCSDTVVTNDTHVFVYRKGFIILNKEGLFKIFS